MLEILQFIFSSFWIFSGTMCLIGIIFQGAGYCISMWRSKDAEDLS